MTQDQIDLHANILIHQFLEQCGLDVVSQRELMAVAGAQAEAELRMASAHAESLGEEPVDFKSLEERKHAATLRGRELASQAVALITAPVGHA
jgi:hypothetical protein